MKFVILILLVTSTSYAGKKEPNNKQYWKQLSAPKIMEKDKKSEDQLNDDVRAMQLTVVIDADRDAAAEAEAEAEGEVRPLVSAVLGVAIETWSSRVIPPSTQQPNQTVADPVVRPTSNLVRTGHRGSSETK